MLQKLHCRIFHAVSCNINCYSTAYPQDLEDMKKEIRLPYRFPVSGFEEKMWDSANRSFAWALKHNT